MAYSSTIWSNTLNLVLIWFDKNQLALKSVLVGITWTLKSYLTFLFCSDNEAKWTTSWYFLLKSKSNKSCLICSFHGFKKCVFGESFVECFSALRLCERPFLCKVSHKPCSLNPLKTHWAVIKCEMPFVPRLNPCLNTRWQHFHMQQKQ